MKQNWTIKNKKDDFVAICREQGITEVTARLLVNRGLTTKEERDAYLHPSFSCLPEASLLKNAQAAAKIIYENIQAGKKFRIIGDYDVDGITSVYILMRCLTAAGAVVDYRIPDRIKDGYGLNFDMVEEAIAAGIEVIVTCDNGIAAPEPISLAKQAGITVVLTDHHEVPVEETADGMKQKLPPADVIVNPKQEGETTPMTGICGAVVAFKVMQCLERLVNSAEADCSNRAPAEEVCGHSTTGLRKDVLLGMAGEAVNGSGAALTGNLLRTMIPYAAMATICDVMELRGENRVLVALGLEMVRNCSDIGLCALIEENQIVQENISSYHMGFVLGPCLNASGRLDVAVKGLQLLLEKDPAKAAEMAKEITELNRVRKEMTVKGLEKAKEIVLGEKELPPVLVVYLPECHESLAGIIAGRVREAFYRPTIILTDAEDGIKGSGRSIDGYHMFEALCECEDLLSKFGGHPKAAGMSLPKENMEEFRNRLITNCRLTEEDLTEKVSIDVVLPFGLVTEQVIEELHRLEPFGVGNEKPMFAERDVMLRRARILGKNANVLKLEAENAYGRQFDTMYFGDIGAFEEEVRSVYGQHELDLLYQGRPNKIKLHMIYYPDKNVFRDTVTLQAVMQYYKVV